MKITRQLLRQPLKTFSGILLMTLAVAILCTCVGQALAARTTTEKLNQQFSTVVIPLAAKTENLGAVSYSASVNEDVLAWLNQMAVEHPDIVKQISHHGILSAYIPKLTPLNITTERYMAETLTQGNIGFYFYQSEPYAVPYSCAMLVITLDEVSEPEEITTSYPIENLSHSDFSSYAEYKEWLANAAQKAVTRGYTVKLTGTVTDVISLQEGYRNSTGRIARLTMTAPTIEQINELNLIPGEQYVVYGMDYVDEYWKLIGELKLDGRYDWMEFEPFDPSKLVAMDEWERKKFQAYYELFQAEEFKDACAYFYGIMIDQREYAMVNALSMTLALPIPMTEYEAIRENTDGKLLELRPIHDVTYTDAAGKTITIPNEEYTDRYQIPTIARLEGSLEDFLSSAEGSLWKNALERDVINNQSFPIIGVDNLNYLADFSLEKTKIVKGRNFTVEELETGARVCIIHEELAFANGLEVGDIVTTHLYSTDWGLPYQNKGLLNPTASFYFDTTPFVETAEYTIVGICRGERTFPDVAQNEYAFSSNTIYVPKFSVQAEMETNNSVAFITPVIHNGKLEEFHALAKQSGYMDCFKYNDQGYSVIAENFHNYAALAEQVLTIGAAIYIVLLLLFLLLYPGTQRKAVQNMESLGVPYFRRLAHVLTSSMAIILPATALGGIVGILLWDWVAEVLQSTAGSSVTLELQSGAQAAVACAQLLLALLLNILLSIPVAAHQKLSRRR